MSKAKQQQLQLLEEKYNGLLYEEYVRYNNLQNEKDKFIDNNNKKIQELNN